MRITSTPTYARRRSFGMVDLFSEQLPGMDLLSDDEDGVDLTQQSDGEDVIVQPDAPPPATLAWYQQRRYQIAAGAVGVIAIVLAGIAVASHTES